MLLKHKNTLFDYELKRSDNNEGLKEGDFWINVDLTIKNDEIDLRYIRDAISYFELKELDDKLKKFRSSNNKKKELNYGIVGGTVAVCVAIAVVMFAQISNINTPMIGSSDTFVWNADIPNLILAAKIWKPFSAIFAIIVFAGIYTTAVPLLYNPASRFAKEGTSQFKILTIVLGVLGLIVGLFLPFRVLVNIIYVLNGYVGAVLILFMIYKNIKDLMNKKKAN